MRAAQTKIKICGLSATADACLVNAALPDYAGFVFYEKSRRNVSPELARRLREALRPSIITVGVFVDSPPDFILRLCREQIIDIVQLHGGQDEAFIAGLRKRLPGVPIWAAFRISAEGDVRAAAKSSADMVLLDGGAGSGLAFDWSFAGGLERPFILAGGLTPESIPEAVARLHPYAVDISSGVESCGRKDGRKIIAAVAAARGIKSEKGGLGIV